MDLARLLQAEVDGVQYRCDVCLVIRWMQPEFIDEEPRRRVPTIRGGGGDWKGGRSVTVKCGVTGCFLPFVLVGMMMIMMLLMAASERKGKEMSVSHSGCVGIYILPKFL